MHMENKMVRVWYEPDKRAFMVEAPTVEDVIRLHRVFTNQIQPQMASERDEWIETPRTDKPLEDGLSVIEFLKRYPSAKSHRDKLLIFALYREHVEGEYIFSKQEIVKYWVTGGVVAPKNVSDMIFKNSRDGYISCHHRLGLFKYWVLTDEGRKRANQLTRKRRKKRGI